MGFPCWNCVKIVTCHIFFSVTRIEKFPLKRIGRIYAEVWNFPVNVLRVNRALDSMNRLNLKVLNRINRVSGKQPPSICHIREPTNLSSSLQQTCQDQSCPLVTSEEMSGCHISLSLGIQVPNSQSSSLLGKRSSDWLWSLHLHTDIYYFKNASSIL